jgi:Flp pilus assembly protein TadB
MAEQSSQGSSGGSLLLTALAGAVLGAAGLAWWLVSEADRRRQTPLRREMDKLPSAQALVAEAVGPGAQPNRDLHDKVHSLNQAIEEVRRQLEAMEAGH